MILYVKHVTQSSFMFHYQMASYRMIGVKFAQKNLSIF
jgi:hypothetical protein